MFTPFENCQGVRFDMGAEPAILLIEPRLTYGIALQIEHVDIRRVAQRCGEILTVQSLPGVQVRLVDAQVVGAESIEQVVRIHIATGDSDCGELGDGRRLRHGGAGELAFEFWSGKVFQPQGPALRIIAKYQTIDHGDARPGCE